MPCVSVLESSSKYLIKPQADVRNILGSLHKYRKEARNTTEAENGGDKRFQNQADNGTDSPCRAHVAYRGQAGQDYSYECFATDCDYDLLHSSCTG